MALRLRGAGGECPQISGPRQRACRWLQWPPPGARECARGPLRANGPNKARYIIRAGPTGPGPLQGRVAQAPPRWGQRQAASGGGRAARQGLCARGRDRAPAAGQCKGGIAAAPSARLALALLRRLCQRQPRAQADRPPPQVARAGSAASRQQALRGVASGLRCARPASRGTFWQRGAAARGHGAARRDGEHPPDGAPKGQQARKVRPLGRVSAATQGRANAARMGWSRL